MRYEVHPNHQPASCYVADLQMDDDIKLEWLAQELGDEANLTDFAKKFKELFGEKLKRKMQKPRCLELYRRYAKIETSKDLKQGPYAPRAEEHNRLAQKMRYSMQAQVPPEELEEFEKLWDEDAPRRCHECNCELPADTPPEQHLCTNHIDAGKQITCGRVVEYTVVPQSTREATETEEAGAGASSYELPEKVIVHRCDGTVTAVGGCRVCTKCGRGAEVAETCTKILDRVTKTKRKERS